MLSAAKPPLSKLRSSQLRDNSSKPQTNISSRKRSASNNNSRERGPESLYMKNTVSKEMKLKKQPTHTRVSGSKRALLTPSKLADGTPLPSSNDPTPRGRSNRGTNSEKVTQPHRQVSTSYSARKYTETEGIRGSSCHWSSRAKK